MSYDPFTGAIFDGRTARAACGHAIPYTTESACADRVEKLGPGCPFPPDWQAWCSECDSEVTLLCDIAAQHTIEGL